MRVKFRKPKLSAANMDRLHTINAIIREYQGAGYKLTLRQLYYQLVSRDVIPNSDKEYKKLSGLLTEGRMGGIVDWDAIEDRLREPYTPNEFDSTADAMDTIISVYRKRRMEGQENYLEVWVEKDALSGVLKRVTSKYHVPIQVNRGYSSVTAMYDSYNRFKDAMGINQKVTILYLGDFDPSGLDMIRDIRDRIQDFMLKFFVDRIDTDYGEEGAYDRFTEWYADNFEVVPVALTRKQITQYKPPPNPAKITDPRAKDFIREHGNKSWEVDALKPEVLHKLLEDAILERIDVDLYESILIQERADKEKLDNLKDEL